MKQENKTNGKKNLNQQEVLDEGVRK